VPLTRSSINLYLASPRYPVESYMDHLEKGHSTLVSGRPIRRAHFSRPISTSLGPWTIDTTFADTTWPFYYDARTKTACENILDDYWPMSREPTRKRDQYKFSNDHPDNTPLSSLPPQATPTTLLTRTRNSVTLSVHTASIRQTVT
jgi:hypothetical protein